MPPAVRHAAHGPRGPHPGRTRRPRAGHRRGTPQPPGHRREQRTRTARHTTAPARGRPLGAPRRRGTLPPHHVRPHRPATPTHHPLPERRCPMSDTGAVRPLPAPRPLGFPHRFRLHRAGIHNVWQYDQVFHFGTGRLLLRGTNGAGKSKALEMLLPFLLDGRTRSIDSTGSGKTTLKWLMLDGYRDSVNRLGYLWVEFHRTDPEGREHLLTLGAAITASQSAKRADAEYFITDIPVGPRLPLHDRTRRPTVRELRETVGEGCHFTQASAYRAEVMRRLFGVQDSGKYHNLLHLLYQLRKPTVGDRVLAGELTKILDESLPPLDDEIIDTVARNLNDLDSVRDELARLEQTTTAVAQFLRDYRRYLHGVLR